MTPAEQIIPESAPPIPTKAPYSLFELRAPYVSVSAMSRERRRGVGCRAQSKDTEGTTDVLDETGSVTTAEPTKETRSEEDLDLPWQVVVHNDPVNLMSYVTMVFHGGSAIPARRAKDNFWEWIKREVRSCGPASRRLATLIG